MKVGYVRAVYEFGWCREVEERRTREYTAGVKRAAKKKATPEDIKRHNQYRREVHVRRMIKNNFQKNDLWITLTYRKENRPDIEQFKKDIHAFLKRLRKAYRQYGHELKYILRLEIGKKGAPHVHILINRIRNQEITSDIIVKEQWKHGSSHFENLYQEGGYKKLAEYITKPIQEWEDTRIKRYQLSRNLKKPEKKEKEVNKRKLVDKYGKILCPKAPKGYYVDPESIITGINPVTGYIYRHYTLIKIEGDRKKCGK